MKRFKIQAVIFTALRSKSVVRLLSEPNQIGSVIDQGKPPALPVDSQKFDICGSRHSGSVFEPESRVLKHAKTVRLLPLAIRRKVCRVARSWDALILAGRSFPGQICETS